MARQTSLADLFFFLSFFKFSLCQAAAEAGRTQTPGKTIKKRDTLGFTPTSSKTQPSPCWDEDLHYLPALLRFQPRQPLMSLHHVDDPSHQPERNHKGANLMAKYSIYFQSSNFFPFLCEVKKAAARQLRVCTSLPLPLLQLHPNLCTPHGRPDCAALSLGTTCATLWQSCDGAHFVRAEHSGAVCPARTTAHKQ